MPPPSSWGTERFYYPIGDTPAACYTEDLPPEKGANVLLLGCGECRSVLYTVYSDLQLDSGVFKKSCKIFGCLVVLTPQSWYSGYRKLDFTCCDDEPSVLGMLASIANIIH